MATKDTTGVPPVPASKTTNMEKLDKGQKAQNTGGDIMDRYRGQYAKTPPVRDDPFAGF